MTATPLWLLWLTMSNFTLGPALTSIGRRSARLAVGLVFGDADERLLNKLGHDALVLAVSGLCNDPGQVEVLVRVVDEHFAPGQLQLEARSVAATSPARAMAASITLQLADLFEPIHDGRSTAEIFGLNGTAEEFAEAILRSLAFLAAFEPRDAYFVHALREELNAASASAAAAIGRAPLPEVTVRYLVCKAFDVVAEMCDHVFDAVPVDNPLWIDNEVSTFWRRLIARNGDRYRSTEVPGDCFDTTASYLRAHPEAVPPSDDQGLPYYRLVRSAGGPDVPKIAESDPLTADLIADGVAVADVALGVVHHEECGDPPLPVVETFLTRPVWAVVAEIRVGTMTTSLKHLEAERPARGPIAIDDAAAPLESTTVALPEAPVSHEQSVLIPVATLVPHLPIRASGTHELRYDWLEDEGRTQSGSYGDLGPQRFSYWGPVLLPRRLALVADGRIMTVDLRNFDPTKAFVVDRSWAVGSCPHLFEIIGDGTCRYIGSAFGAAPHAVQRYSIDLRADATSLVVAELEDEETTFREVRIDGRFVAENVVVARGEMLSFDLPGWPVRLDLVGWYEPKHGQLRAGSASRNAAIRDFLGARRPRLHA